MLAGGFSFARSAQGWLPNTVDNAIVQAEETLSIPSIVHSLSLEKKIAQLIVVLPEGVLGSGVCYWVGSDLWEALCELPIGGVLLKDVHFVSPEQVRELTGGLQQCSQYGCGLPMLISVDEEGGTVVRVSDKAAFGVEDPGSMRYLGETGNVELAESEAFRVGSYLRDLGVNLDYAPVADVTNDTTSFVYKRSFGGDADLVADMVAAQVRGFNAAGTLCSPKHFPGIGEVKGDSHVESIYLDKSLDEMWSYELKPFAAAVEAGAPLVMVGHMTCNSLDASMPACLSHAVVKDVLRDGLGFDGVVITDSLGMAAVNELYSSYEVGVLALEAGCDLLLCPVDWRACVEGIKDAVQSGRLSEERINESVERIVRMKLTLGN